MPSITASQRYSTPSGPTSLSQWHSVQNESATSVNAASVVLSLRQQLGRDGVVGFAIFLSALKQVGGTLQCVSKAQLKKLCLAHNIKISDIEVRSLVLFVNDDPNAAVPCATLRDLILGKLEGTRLDLVTRAFQKLDTRDRGYVAVEDILRAHDAAMHPSLMFSKATATQVQAEFVKGFTSLMPLCTLVNLQQWTEYIQCVGAATAKHDLFELVLTRVWHVSPPSNNYEAMPASQPALATSTTSLLSDLSSRNLLATALDFKGAKASYFESPRSTADNINIVASTVSYDAAGNIPRKTSRNATLNSVQTAACMAHASTDRNGLLPKPKEVSVGTKMILGRLRASLKARGAAGIVGLSRKFRLMDEDGNGSIDLAEFKRAMRDCNVECSDADMRLLFDAFDSDDSQSIDFKEFLDGVREPMNERRLALVRAAFQKMDKNGDGVVDPSDIVGTYDASKHPDVIAGKRTQDDIFREFLDTFDVDVKDGKVMRDEWEHYYHNVSAVIDSDDYFELMMRNAWQLSGGTGWAASTFEANTSKGSAWEPEDAAVPRATFATPKRYGNASAGASSCLHVESAAALTSTTPADLQHPRELRRIVKRLKTTLKARGARGFTGLSRSFRTMDTNGSGTLDMNEFRAALEHLSVHLSANDILTLFDYFDTDGSGSISLTEFCRGVRDPMNERRLVLVRMAFDLMDVDKNHVITIEDVYQRYDAKKSPEVIAGRKTERDVYSEFLDTFESGSRVHDGRVTLDEWTEYYANISASIDDDDYFELMMRNAWHISGGDGWCANSTNRRVLVNDNQVVEIENDLGVTAARDIQERLEKKLGAKAKVSFYDVLDHSVRPVERTTRVRARNNASAGAATCLSMGHDEKLRKLTGAPKAQTAAMAPVGVQPILARFKSHLKLRPTNGYIALHRAFRRFDTDGNGHLSMLEFKRALANFEISEVDARILFHYFDLDHSGTVEIAEFVTGLRDPMNSRRLGLVRQAFRLMDKDSNGVLEPSDIVEAYDASKHPDVIAGRKSPDAVFREFLDTFDVDGVHDARITPLMWEHYYANISAVIEDDDYFELMMRNAWHISGGEGWCANSTNRRVLVNDTAVVEIENDLGLNAGNLRTRLDAQLARTSHMNQPGTIKTLDSMNVFACLNHIDPPPAPANSHQKTPPKRITLNEITAKAADAPARPPPAAPDQVDGLWGALRLQLRRKDKLVIVQTRRALQSAGKSVTAAQLQSALSGANLAITLPIATALIEDARRRNLGPNKWDAGDVTTPKAPTGVVWHCLSTPLDSSVVRMAKRIFAQLQMDGKGDVTPLLLAKAYDAPNHPQVVLGLAKADDVFKEFASCFDVDATGHITYESIETYCGDLLSFVGDTTHCLQVLRDSFHVDIPTS
ncbi:hypothetical protein ACHHYP_08146 [Achlya hypogyna]|uniref:EF-hand domain-containing protein n=1 Tax=Achlya hypogyna TaxID=1202772 RepID=A0A1V9ZL96_ACHHY|nr:hypothetical protein ACHHYP_08146 [Achlya hypogyna]